MEVVTWVCITLAGLIALLAAIFWPLRSPFGSDFALVELLLVLACIGVVIALLAVPLATVREIQSRPRITSRYIGRLPDGDNLYEIDLGASTYYFTPSAHTVFLKPAPEAERP